MDEQGYVHVWQRLGLGLEINFDSIQEYAVSAA